MAALRHAARRLCERSLQRAQASSPVAAQEQRRLFLHGSSPGRRLMSNSTVTGKTEPTIGSQEKQFVLEQLEKREQELEDIFNGIRRKKGITIIATKKNFRKSQTRDNGTAGKICFFVSLCFFMGSYYKQQYNSEPKILPEGTKKEQNDEGAKKKGAK